MMIAAMAGIRVFATGGIGGVHRGAETSFDISADLIELGRTPVAVVCAGAKAILDIPKTLEYLETQGVPVIGWKSDEFPVFYSRRSGHKLDHHFDDAHKLAEMLNLHFDLGMGGVLITNRCPRSSRSISRRLRAGSKRHYTRRTCAGVKGKDITPFLLQTIFELTAARASRPISSWSAPMPKRRRRLP